MEVARNTRNVMASKEHPWAIALTFIVIDVGGLLSILCTNTQSELAVILISTASLVGLSAWAVDETRRE